MDLVPPHDIGAERQLLGAALVAPQTIDEIAAVVQPGDFYRPAHDTTWAAIIAQRDSGEPVDAKLVGERLHRDGNLVRVGGLGFLAGLLTGVLTPANGVYYGEIVARLAVFRRVVRAGQRLQQLGYNTQIGLEDLRHRATVEVDAATADRREPDIVWAVDGIAETLASLEQDPQLYKTPWTEVDGLIGGLAPGRLYTIGARPGVGKSVMAVQMAAHHADRFDQAVMLVTLEMSRREVDMRLIAQLAKIDYSQLERHALTEADWDKVAAAQSKIAGLQLAVIDRPGLDIGGIRRDARQLARGRKLGLIVVDYLQLMQAAAEDRHRPRHEVVAEHSRSLKLLCRELEVPLVAVSQLNRAPEARADKRPGLHDLRESGAVEQDSDVVILLHRDVAQAPSRLHVQVAKHRQGPTGATELQFDGQYQRIVMKAWSPSAVLDN